MKCPGLIDRHDSLDHRPVEPFDRFLDSAGRA
jgi:hypothetical protein